MDIWRVIADRKIQEAMEEGAFENLDGAGRPLNLEENPFEDPSQRMAHRLLRNQGFAPAWIEEGKEIDRDVACWNRDASHLDPVELRRRALEINRRIAGFNLKAPVATMHKQPLSIAGESSTS